MSRAKQPIGIFDSGIGGLTVAKAIHQNLPTEDLIYFGDTAHTPWGGQSATAIQHYAVRISETLLKLNCKVIVVACNTASAAAFSAVQQVVKDQALLFNVIDPVIDHLVANHQNKTIGLIGTKQTVKSATYQSRLLQKTDSISLNSLATPLLVPIIEEGFGKTAIAAQMINHYLSNPCMANISALILGCTHYPFIKQQVIDFFKQQVEIIDSAQLISNVIDKQLEVHQLHNDQQNPKMTFYVSHDSEFFNQTAQQFFPGGVKLETFPLWD